jgi:phosphocarrier protein
MSDTVIGQEVDGQDNVSLKVRVTLTNIRGLHARASAKFVTCAEGFSSVVKVTSHNCVGAETVIADSVMELLMLGSAVGEDISISVTGPQDDAEAALEALTGLVENNFGETE